MNHYYAAKGCENRNIIRNLKFLTYLFADSYGGRKFWRPKTKSTEFQVGSLYSTISVPFILLWPEPQ